jgi:hypothetical protein
LLAERLWVSLDSTCYRMMLTRIGRGAIVKQ